MSMALGYNSLWSDVCGMVTRSFTWWINKSGSMVLFAGQADFSVTPTSHSSGEFASTSKFSLFPFFSALSSSSALSQKKTLLLSGVQKYSNEICVIRRLKSLNSAYLSLWSNQNLLYRKSIRLRQCNVLETKVKALRSTQPNFGLEMPPSTNHSHADWT